MREILLVTRIEFATWNIKQLDRHTVRIGITVVLNTTIGEAHERGIVASLGENTATQRCRAIVAHAEGRGNTAVVFPMLSPPRCARLVWDRAEVELRQPLDRAPLVTRFQGESHEMRSSSPQNREQTRLRKCPSPEQRLVNTSPRRASTRGSPYTPNPKLKSKV
ncbi:hypothetical protein [Mesorhizobium sp. B2-6-4]|uniref:hypothetical protein n=1 Tax=Mesorhizobium sp. B2-6-4 TaxID=2589913 RepID=UPI0011285A60|nr:hypothetical protein [Mesorhizobium sp. B2-6-4]TPJ54727.1 hypothetical protein FJ426_06965 [Mesorhizobium sp. B2-6-4]